MANAMGMPMPVVLDLAAAFGGLTLYGAKGQDGQWTFSTKLVDDAPEAIGEDSLRSNSEFDTLFAALASFDQYPWQTFKPLQVHPELRQDILAQALVRLGDHAPPGRVALWRRVCRVTT